MFVMGSLVIIIAFIGGMKFTENLWAAGESVYEQISRFNYVMQLIRDHYVEEPDMNVLLEGAIDGMLASLDPHSVYISPEDQQRIAEQFAGEFEGIGIRFDIQNSILTVISPIPGTPADLLGIRSGDQIIKINDVSTFGITNEGVFEKLRGPKGTQVDVTVRRPGMKETLDYTITRDKIPINSVETSFMLDAETGYILLNQFTSTTNEEIKQALENMYQNGMKQLLFDLRNNAGGYLQQAIAVLGEFIGDKQRLVYTMGRESDSERSFFAPEEAPFYDLPLIVLVSHGSASASEIVAGAVQDLDRGLVVGQTTFGKGLVQQGFPLGDGAVVRITTERYYTPSGRLIQRAYEDGLAEYISDAYDEEDPNEQPDSLKEVFVTSKGRNVYGGGGITPDVKASTDYFSAYGGRLMRQRIFFEYANEYCAEHPEINGDFEDFLKDYQPTEEMLQGLIAKGAEHEIEYDEDGFNRDRQFLALLLKAEMAQIYWNNRVYYYRVRALNDKQIQTSLNLFDQAREVAGL
ncbi:peptidase [candidate division LCP-89 bacterium B3_LCP]|uniref:Peptidase n=1 Tax=candidate division LCP-89 bacterium B3_LCP TaxID=2012998 RepID=A0A532UXQ5_UNCL8|nr:MAG: peptidase [candidate division LCP-89 bacterium B3_LCP]